MTAGAGAELLGVELTLIPPAESGEAVGSKLAAVDATPEAEVDVTTSVESDAGSVVVKVMVEVEDGELVVTCTVGGAAGDDGDTVTETVVVS